MSLEWLLIYISFLVLLGILFPPLWLVYLGVTIANLYSKRR